MRRSVFGAIAILVAATALPLALAGSAPSGEGFFDVALPVGVAGDVLARAHNAHLVGIGGGPAFQFSLQAEELRVVRTSAEKLVLSNPATGVVYEEYSDPVRTESVFGPSAVRVTRAGVEATLFTSPVDTGETSSSLVEARTNGAVHVIASPFARFTTLDPSTASTDPANEDRLEYSLDETLATPHFQATGASAYVVTGTFEIFLWDVDVVVTPAAGESAAFTTGHRGRDPAAIVATEEDANVRLLVTNGALTFHGAGSSTVAASAVALAVTGEVFLPGAVGGYSDGASRYEADGKDLRLAGDVLLVLSLVADRYDRALVTLTGEVAALSLAPLPPLDKGAFLGSPVGKAAAASGVLVLAAGSVLLLQRRDPIQRLLRPRSGPASDPAEAAVLALERDEPATAAALLARVLEKRPDDVVLLVDYGAALERLGRVEEARNAYERAVRLAPARGEAHYYYSRTLLALGLTASALPHLQRALYLDPRLREMARADAGFRGFADHPGFLALVG